MKSIALAGLLALAATPAMAQMYPPDVPVCMQVYGRPSYTDCSFASVPQCQASASGRAAMCIVNPFFQPRQPPPRRKRRR